MNGFVCKSEVFGSQVRFCFGSWSDHFYVMSWTGRARSLVFYMPRGEYYQLFVELNELAKVGAIDLFKRAFL